MNSQTSKVVFQNPDIGLDTIPLSKTFVDGAWAKPKGAQRAALVSPATEQEFGSVILATETDVSGAAAAASAAFHDGSWPRLTFAERADWLHRLADAIETRSMDLAYAWSQQMGILHRAALTGAEQLAPTVRTYASIASSFDGAQFKEPKGHGAGYLLYEPAGVVAAITPWNAPGPLMIQKIAPALAAGCTVIMKPAPETPIEAYIFAQCAEQIGLPPGVLNLICAERDVSDALVRDSRVDKVSFTGSVAAGRHIASVCGVRMARCALELGGKSAAIILDDYDLGAAAKSLAASICSLNGQSCIALTRLLVHRARQNEFVEKLKAELAKIVIGDPYDPAANIGPLAMERQQKSVLSHIDTAIKEGARLVHGGRIPEGMAAGFFIEPTLFADVESHMTIAREEVFGPVLCVIPFDSEDDAIRIANASDYGLSGAVFTNSAVKAFAVARQLRTGTVGHNGSRADASIGFGGFKMSGIGREGGMQGFLGYLETKTVLLDEAV